MIRTGTMRSEIHQNYSAQVPSHTVTLIFLFTKVTGHFVSGILLDHRPLQLTVEFHRPDDFCPGKIQYKKHFFLCPLVQHD
jgi:hypothetical protein